MSPENKNRLELGAKVLLLAIWALLTIATCAGVWSYCPEKAVKVFALILFLCNGVAIAILVKRAFKKYNDVLEVLFPKHDINHPV